MPWYYIVLIVLGSLVVLYLIFIVALTLLINSIFKRRQDRQPGFHYFSGDDFNDIDVTPIEIINRNNNKLRGYVYRSSLEQNQAAEVIIFYPGLGMGHLAYGKEIAKLARETGLPVISVDYQGCDLSEGNKTQGFYKTIYDAIAIIKYAEANFPNYLIHLVGHSWGGWLAGNVGSVYKSPHLASITVLSAPNSLPDIMKGFLKNGIFAKGIINATIALMNGKLAKIKTVKSIVDNQIPTLVIHGRQDQLVAYNESGRLYINAASGVSHIRPLIFNDKGHNVYLSNESEQKLIDLNNALASFKKDQTKREDYLANVDWNTLTEPDETVFAVIKDLIRINGHGKD